MNSDLKFEVTPSRFRMEESRLKEVYAGRNEMDPRYSWFNPGHLFIIHERERQFLALLQQYDFTSLQTKRILEIGCGTGYWLREFIKLGARPENLAGVDLLPEVIAEARALCPEGVNVHCSDATSIGFDDSTFDLVLQSTVFTSVLDEGMKRQIASEMIRVLKPDGLILWYDFHINNPWNADVRGVKKREVYALFPGCHIKLKRVTLAPPLARLVAPRSWLIAYLLGKIPFLRSHYIGVITRSK